MTKCYAMRVTMGDEKRIKNRFDSELNKKKEICLIQIVELSLKRKVQE